MTLVPRISLVLSGLMVSLPFLNFHHSLPLPTFYTEWLAFALGTAALLPLALAEYYCAEIDAPVVVEIKRDGVVYARVYDIRGRSIGNLLTVPGL